MASITADIQSAHATGAAARSRIIGVAFALWLGLFPLANFLFRNKPLHALADFEDVRMPNQTLATMLVSLALAIAAPALLAASLGLDFRRSKYLVPAVFVLCLSIPLSYLPVSDPKLLLYVVLVDWVILWSIVSVSSNVDETVMMTSLLSTLALAHGAVLAWILKDHDVAWGRLYGRDTPAYWGMVAQAAVIASIAMRGQILRLAVIVVSLAALYMTQSRGSMLALAVGLTTAFAIFASKSRWRGPIWAGALVAALFIGLLGAGFIADDLFLVSDPGRGASSGLSGRTGAWGETMQLIANNPLIGVGYRQHEQYLITEATAHNAYLATMADTGVIGFLGYMLFLVGGAWRAVLKALARPNGANLASAGFLAAFLVNGLVERNALNTGNAYCQLMILLTAWSWRKDDPEPDAVQRRWTPAPRSA